MQPTKVTKKRSLIGIQWAINLVILVGVALFFYRLNRITGYTGDDYLYHFVYYGEWPTKHLRAIHNLGDWIQSTINQAQLWNGRFVAQSLVQLFMQFPKSVFNVANTLIFMVVGLMINLLVQRRSTTLHPLTLLTTYCAMFYFLPDFGRAVLWLSGSFNYLWMAVIYLGYFWFLRWQYVPSKPSANFDLGIILLAFLVGVTNENIAPVMIILTYFYYVQSKDDHFRKYVYPCMFSITAGFVILITHNNGEAAAEDGQRFQFAKISKQFIHFDGLLLLVAVFLTIIIAKRHRQDDHQNLQAICALIGGSLLSIGALLLSPQVPPRTYFGSVLFLITACLIGLRTVLQGKNKAWMVMTCCAIVMSGVAGQRYVAVYPQLLSNYARFYTVQQAVQKAHQQHQKVIQVPGMNPACSYSAYYQTAYLLPGSVQNLPWENTWMAKYYGLKAVILNNQVPVQKVPKNLQ